MAKKKNENQLEEGVFDKINLLFPVFYKEDKRGLILSVAAFAEDCLGRLLIAFMRDCKDVKDLVEGFNAFLGTFSARIKACFTMGLLSREQAADLDHIRKVRNEFAHSWMEYLLRSNR